MNQKELYKIYIELDENGYLIDVYSTAFNYEERLKKSGYIYVDEGNDEQCYRYGGSNYLRIKYGEPISDMYHFPNYIYKDSKLRLLTKEEKQVMIDEMNSNVNQPTEQEKVNAQLMREIATLKLAMGGGKNV